MSDNGIMSNRRWLIGLGAAVALALAGWLGWSLHQRQQGGAGELDRQLAAAGFDSRQRGAMEALVRQYLLDHPEVLPEAMERLQQREAAARVGPLRPALEKAYPGAVLGNPQGKLTLVEFTDYACTYCRASVADVKALISAHPDLKIVIRELPILSKDSEAAARVALAAARQGKYAPFHDALYRQAHPDAAGLAAAAREANVDLTAAKAVVGDPDIGGELQQNIELARQIGVSGTPAWVIGNQVLSGAVGRERLAQAIAEARKDRG